MRLFSSLLIAVHLIAPGYAEKGRTYEELAGYKSVTIREVLPDAVSVIHATGSARIPIERLPPEVAQELGLDSGLAALHRKNLDESNKQASKRQKAAALLKNRKSLVTGRVQRVAEDGVFVSPAYYTTDKMIEVRKKHIVREGGPTTLDPHKPVRTYRRYTTEEVPDVVMTQVVFFSCDPTTYYDGIAFRKEGYSHGTHQYTDTDGAVKTVLGFTDDPTAVLASAGYKKDVLESSEGYRSGTGFLITPSGYILTCYHLVSDREEITVRHKGEKLPAKLMLHDAIHDIALLKSDISGGEWLDLGKNPKSSVGESVMTVSHSGGQENEPARFTEGTISSMSGPMNNPSYLYMSIPRILGNPGGPLVNGEGKVIGIIFPQLPEALRGADPTPQQATPHAIKIQRAIDLFGPTFIAPKPHLAPPSQKQLIERVTRAVVLVEAR